MARLSSLGQALAADRRGSTILMFALSLGVLSVLCAGGIELAFLSADRAKLQQSADAAALFGAAELTMSSATGVIARAEDYASTQWGVAGKRMSAQASAKVIDNADGSRSLEVDITGHRDSFFGNMVPAGGFNVAVHATALAVGMEPLCVLVHEKVDKGDTLHVANKSQIQAPNCLVQSNNDIKVDGQGLIAAGLTQAVNTAQGPITPAARIGAKAIPDPFLNMTLQAKSCGALGLGVVTGALLPQVFSDGGTDTLAAGMHCGGIDVKNGTTLVLGAGEHFFAGDLNLEDTSKLSGSDVVLGFDDTSKFTFGGQSQVSLSGRKTGSYAGFVAYTTRTNTKDFEISSDHVTQLLGTIYIPKAKLHVDGNGKVAQQSAWTVIVAQSLQMDGNAQLYMNANYSQTDVPVPSGVGPNARDTRLTN